MNKEKQIEEMARIMNKANGRDDDSTYFVQDATDIYNAGYRKASEVAREIFEEIERETKNHGITYTQRKIAELKKKYTGSEKKNEKQIKRFD